MYSLYILANKSITTFFFQNCAHLYSYYFPLSKPTSESDIPNGSFNVSSIKIVETVPDIVFGKMFVFQVSIIIN